MQQELTQEILQRLDALAAKLGTTVEYLWPALVKEQVAQGVVQMLIAIPPLAAALACRWIYPRALAKANKDMQEYEEKQAGMPRHLSFLNDSPDRFYPYTILIVGWLFAATAIIMFVAGAYDGIPKIVAPEAAALRGLFQ